MAAHVVDGGLVSFLTGTALCLGLSQTAGGEVGCTESRSQSQQTETGRKRDKRCK